MTQHHFEPRALLTVMEAARQLHVSDDTVRRQIRAGDLEAIQVGTTPTGRPRYRIPALAIAERLGQPAAAISAAERLHAAFGQLTQAQQEALVTQALAWARATQPVSVTTRHPALTAAELDRRVSPKGRQLMALQD